jgi:hypothetical protein
MRHLWIRGGFEMGFYLAAPDIGLKQGSDQGIGGSSAGFSR